KAAHVSRKAEKRKTFSSSGLAESKKGSTFAARFDRKGERSKREKKRFKKVFFVCLQVAKRRLPLQPASTGRGLKHADCLTG
ncbi:hypothetical protein, partial [Hymenobacter lapidiphilus]|uniref:hypothetical protein n=1 Tax=Hymenobacter lapidiphilus TaxID=2608003 RepID=UPI001C409E88